MRVIAVWFSRTGTTRQVAQQAKDHLRARGHDVAEGRLQPRWDLPYPLWLALSFVPGSRFPLHPPVPEPSRYDACLLALPKWTFSCPPVNEFLARAGASLPPTAVVVTCGGWDQDRYLTALEGHLRRLGASVRGGLTVKRKALASGGRVPALEGFLDRCFPPGVGDERIAEDDDAIPGRAVE